MAMFLLLPAPESAEASGLPSPCLINAEDFNLPGWSPGLCRSLHLGEVDSVPFSRWYFGLHTFLASIAAQLHIFDSGEMVVSSSPASQGSRECQSGGEWRKGRGTQAVEDMASNGIFSGGDQKSF